MLLDYRHLRFASVLILLAAACDPAVGQETAVDSLHSLHPADGLEVSLWASEPMVNNPTAMDIDSRGRVWIAEGLNYRMKQKQFDSLHRVKDADRIKILSDTNGDGKADKVTVFADNIFPVPLGMAVEEIWKNGKQIGTRVYIGNSPDLLVLEDTDGDDKADKRYSMLTGFRGVDSDHGLHGMTLAPDGRLYFTVGDARYGADKVQQGKPTFDVTDKSGRRLTASRAGTVLRVNLDGTNLEVLAYGHRNDYEAAVDSFGNVFASDNDDDGNRGCRTTWIMDGGDYGYKHPNSSRHWAEELPGVIPKMVGTGNGAPGGLTIYEGDGLPPAFSYSAIQVDSATHQVNAHPLTRFGAGFRSDHKVLLKGEDSWFRPVDVTVAPDGSLFICDWYDAGVGGNRFSDQDTGRIYQLRRTVDQTSLDKNGDKTTSADFDSVQGLITALQSPNTATRSVARQLLIASPAKARLALRKLQQKGLPAMRARALFVLADLPETGRQDVIAALEDDDPRLRETALQILARDAARESLVTADPAGHVPPPAVAVLADILSLVEDPDAGVRRALIMAIRNVSTDQVGDALVRLTQSWDGRDRYYLEALRAALVNRETAFLQSLFTVLAENTTDTDEREGSIALPPFYPTITNDAFLRPDDELPPSNAASTVLGLAWSLQRAEALPAIRRALKTNRSEFIEQAADAALSQLSDVAAGELMIERLAMAIQNPQAARERLRGIAIGITGPWSDLHNNASLHRSISTALKNPKLSVAASQAIGKCKFIGFTDQLMAIAQDRSINIENRAAAIEALGNLKHEPCQTLAVKLLQRSRENGRGDPLAIAGLAVIAKLGGIQAERELLSILSDEAFPADVRRRGLQLLVVNSQGADRLIAIQQQGNLPEDLVSEFSFQIHNHADRNIRRRASELFPTLNASQLDIDAVLSLSGDAERGRDLFFKNKDIVCSRCHRVGGQGEMLGPDLSSIGTKYGKRELVYHIINPSGAINYNYVGQIVLLDDGRVLVGLVVERSNSGIVLKTPAGETIQIDNDTVEQQRAQSISLMPEGLTSKLNPEQFADLLEFLSTLRQSPKSTKERP